MQSMIGNEGIIKWQMVLYYFIDTSAAMTGVTIATVNSTMRKLLPELKNIDSRNFDVELKIAVLKFDDSAEWVTYKPVAVGDFQWSNLETGGCSNLGEACKLLENKLSKNEFQEEPTDYVVPVIFLMSDGQPTDNFNDGLNVLKRNKWFKYAIKTAIAIGNDAREDVLAQFTGNAKAVVAAHNPEQLEHWIRFVSVTAMKMCSKSSSVAQDEHPEYMQNALINAIQREQQSRNIIGGGYFGSACPDPGFDETEEEW